jgi:signal transduction histidine kinase
MGAWSSREVSLLKRNRILIYLGVLIFSISLFRIAAFKEDQQLVSAAEGLLRNEYNISNPYLISKSLMDLKALGIFRCFLLMDDNNRTYMSDLHHPQCQIKYLNKTVKLKALNGRSYSFTFQKPLYPSLLIEILLTLLALIVTFFYLKFKEAKEELMELKLSLARKVSHDIRSPLKTIKQTMLAHQSSKDNGIALKALERLEEIANDLLDQTKTKPYENISFEVKIDNLISEYKVQHSQVLITVKGTPFSILPKYQGELLRGVSNVIQNSIEANANTVNITFKKADKWQVEIEDDGRGAPDEVTEQLGAIELSTKDEGNGIGIFSFSQWLKSNNARLSFNNRAPGLRVTIELAHSFIVKEIILLDNDPLIQFNWKAHAKKKGILLTTYNRYQELEPKLSKSDKEIVIFIDYELEDSRNGLERIQQLEKKGFTNLYLCTSHRDIQTDILKVDKGFPF